MKLSDGLKTALYCVSQDVVPDLVEGGDDPAVVAEVVMDANRLMTWGFASEDQEMKIVRL